MNVEAEFYRIWVQRGGPENCEWRVEIRLMLCQASNLDLAEVINHCSDQDLLYFTALECAKRLLGPLLKYTADWVDPDER